jgi:Protein of unknown function (DUF1592)/Protein of unknown function (DUF1588)/Protein of unknown function (DUF1595)/Protein of unknown function (DUF1585)
VIIDEVLSNEVGLFSQCESADDLDSARVREVLADFACRAYRRPIDLSELDAWMTMLDDSGASREDFLRRVLTEVLTSPQFLYRVQTLRRDDLTQQSAAFELASRMSFFLWRSTPDRELLALAERDALEENLEAQVKRMLRDPRAQEFARDFVGSWLSLYKLNCQMIVDETLSRAMREETELFTIAILQDDRSVLDFIDADFTFLNEPLAKHYGIDGVKGMHMRRVELTTSQRGGLLTHGSVLNVSCPNSETSPIQRGKWVLETLLGAPPIRPPAGILQAIEKSPKNLGFGSIPKILEAHRANPSCAECHWKMDAIGLSLENFDVGGAWRTGYHSVPLDAVSQLPDGETLNGVVGLKKYLRRHQNQFVVALSEALLRDALGRKLTEAEGAGLKNIPPTTAGQQHRFSSVVTQIVLSEPFRSSASPVPQVD